MILVIEEKAVAMRASKREAEEKSIIKYRN